VNTPHAHHTGTTGAAELAVLLLQIHPCSIMQCIRSYAVARREELVACKQRVEYGAQLDASLLSHIPFQLHLPQARHVVRRTPCTTQTRPATIYACVKNITRIPSVASLTALSFVSVLTVCEAAASGQN